jgi:site-specific recombinase XerD
MSQKLVSGHHLTGISEPGLTLRSAIEGYLLDCYAARQSKRTIENKRSILIHLADYAYGHNWPSVEGLTTNHLRQYLAALQERPRWFGKQGSGLVSASYYETVYRRLKTFFGWLVAEGEIPDSPMSRIKYPKLEERVIPTVPADDFGVLIALTDPALYKTRKGKFRAIRDRAVLWLLADTSARREGLTGLAASDVDLHQRRALVVMEKGRKERYLDFGNTAAKALWRYMVEREKLHPVVDDLWVDAVGNAMQPDWLYRMLQRLGKRAGISNLHTHRFRHTFAVTMIEEGTPLPILEGMAGWKKAPKTYLATIGAKQSREWHRRVSPGDKLAKGIRKRN